MDRSKRKRVLFILNKLNSILPAFFWAFLIFGFEEPHMAVLTITAALIHEGGHLAYIIFFSPSSVSIRSVISGLRISGAKQCGYKEKVATYLSGPISNVLAFVIFSLISIWLGEICLEWAVINLATAISNLMPIEGYDGYGALSTLLEERGMYGGIRVMRRLSAVASGALCIFSLYLIDRVGGGYWIFAVFLISMIKSFRCEADI